MIDRLKEQHVPYHFTVTVTTRPPRFGEVHGVNYFFATEGDFQAMRSKGDLLEWARVHDYHYGTPLEQVRATLRAGKDVFLKIDVQGAAQVKQRVPDAVFVFLGPPTIEDLISRMRQRGTETPEEMGLRIRNAYEEMRQLTEYDYLVINREGMLDEAVYQIKCIVTAEKCRVKPRKIDL